ncbi:AAA family ATPase [Halosimplex aquaticum]|uniref:AAA family ATPase n=1 Tax=Halosimplex aquaticum TaxID=3026162 RepID=A0ABD5Y4B7_9EURY|nr:MoxR family ATPase [Halosimplex aquaticum]
MTDPSELYADVEAEIGTLLIGMEEQIELLTIAALTRGHVLLEGVPGVAKTSLANVFATATGLDYNRIQMTPDTLPADITGTKVYREQTGHFEAQRGPVFANVVVADEINRATPKTQSALLEAMEENQVTIEGDTYPLPEMFMVVATQNPIEMEGVFELPEAQRDRFQVKVMVNLPSRDDELSLIERFHDDPTLTPDDVEQVVGRADLQRAREIVADIHVDESVEEYIVDVVGATRDHPDVSHGASPRATLAFLNTAKARAAIAGRDYVIPDDVKAMAEPILVHRLILSTEAELGEADRAAIVDDVLDSVVPPGGEQSAAEAEPVEQD